MYNFQQKPEPRGELETTMMTPTASFDASTVAPVNRPVSNYASLFAGPRGGGSFKEKMAPFFEMMARMKAAKQGGTVPSQAGGQRPAVMPLQPSFFPGGLLVNARNFAPQMQEHLDRIRTGA